MNKRIFLILLITILLPFLVSCNGSKIVEKDYETITLYKMVDNQKDKVSELKDKKKINQLSDLINESYKKDANKIHFERGRWNTCL
ncbi:hypothetical protein RCG23_13815 [Neobacillus sp. PS3-34]|uniref:hypothetical protein n=1 Tax=Neobacillus sp. PS3-34 TaxID=3070678 RepID=UPI0027DF6EC9|nr:hypothetical protein [Neobacillus sp. PS3-34]WML46721.1 hypothetical protein RCG23_13815 [Neobacillus sp. PS3-34]